MDYQDQNTYFARAYRTGTDHWSHIPFTRRAHEITEHVAKGSLILDLGTGRGKIMFDLAGLGYRVIGLENNPELVARGNNAILLRGQEKELRFFEGDALDIPLANDSFDGLIDMGLLHHIAPEDYSQYVNETTRVLKTGGYFFLAVLSKNTPAFYSWRPVADTKSDYEYEGVKYHFFSDEELKGLFEKNFEIVDFAHDLPYGPKDAIYSVVLLKKR